ncbi:MAG TPA: CYTH and CHAD domain-containing protein, partial [Candidatus Limnocylindrales bacterium]|nr:CYTH and CHAD domain-containing protein [Candidatus Limnocylindrales bacterium]
AGASVAPAEDVRLETIYYDTPDFRLARWGCSLRLREGEGWTLKLPAASDGAALSRRELTFPGEGRRPPEAAVALVLAYVRRSPLQPVATLSTVRHRIRLTDAAGAPLAEVVDDEVAVVEGLRVASRFRQVEVELAPASPEDLLDPLVARLRAAGAGADHAPEKHLLALGRRAMEPPEVTLPEISASSTAAELVKRTIAESVVSLFRHDPGVRLGDDPEDVHRARVATRRLRSQLRTLRPLLRREWSDPLRDELRWLAAGLGDVRDKQVMRQRLDARVPNLSPEDVGALRALSSELAAESEESRSRLVLDMRSDRYIDLLDRLVEAARTPALLPEADQPAATIMPSLVRQDWKRLRKAVRRLPDTPEDASLHRVRILAKRTRYAAEAAAPVSGKRATAFAEAAADLQTVLGDHQDTVSTRRWLREAAQGRVAFVAGQLYVMEADDARTARGLWVKKWKLLDRKRLRRWMI